MKGPREVLLNKPQVISLFDSIESTSNRLELRLYEGVRDYVTHFCNSMSLRCNRISYVKRL